MTPRNDRPREDYFADGLEDEAVHPRRRMSDMCAFHEKSFETFQGLVTAKMNNLETLIDGKFNLLAERISQIRADGQTERVGELEKRIMDLEKRVWKMIGGASVALVVLDVVVRHFFK